MVKKIVVTILALSIAVSASALEPLPTDTIKTAKGDFQITFIGYASLLFEYKGSTIYVDPVGRWADFTKMPKADLILVSENESNHFDLRAIDAIRTPSTTILMAPSCAGTVEGGQVIHTGTIRSAAGIKVEAVPAYDYSHPRGYGGLYRGRGEGNGYVLTFDDKRVYVAADTDLIPEMKSLKNIDVALLPMSQPYNMTPQMAAKAARIIKPKILYPYQYDREDPTELVDLLKGVKGIQVRIRRMTGIGSLTQSGYDTKGITNPSSSYEGLSSPSSSNEGTSKPSNSSEGLSNPSSSDEGISQPSSSSEGISQPSSAY